MSDNETADLRKVAQQAADRGSLLGLHPTTVLNLLHELDDLRAKTEAHALPDVETVARAIYDNQPWGPDANVWDDLPAGARELFWSDARAVLALFSEQPTVAEVRKQVAQEIAQAQDGYGWKSSDISVLFPDDQQAAYMAGANDAVRILTRLAREIGGAS